MRLSWQVLDRVRMSYSKGDLMRKKFLMVLQEPVERDFLAFAHQAHSCEKFLKK